MAQLRDTVVSGDLSFAGSNREVDLETGVSSLKLPGAVQLTNVGAGVLLGRHEGTPGNLQAITLGTGISFSAGALTLAAVLAAIVGNAGAVNLSGTTLTLPANQALTGAPTAPTAPLGTNSTQIATTAFVAAALANLVDSSPGTLDTLNELAAALGDDPAFATTVSTALGNRLRVDAAQGLDAGQKSQARANIGLVLGTDVQAYSAVLAAIANNTGVVDLSGLTLTLPSAFATDAEVSAAVAGRLRFDAAQALDAGQKTQAQANIGLTPGTDVLGYSEDTGVAFVRTTGNDATGAVGNAGRPYLTMQAAFDAGARVFDLGAGTFAGISGLTNSAPLVLWIRGRGANGKTVVNNISGDQPEVDIRDIGLESFDLAGVSVSAVGDGNDGGTVRLYGVRITGAVQANGTAGGSGETSPGGGGIGGLIELERCRMTQSAYLRCNGGMGGENTLSGSPGDGGSGGVIRARYSIVRDPRAIGGDCGPGGNGIGNGADGGSILLKWCEIYHAYEGEPAAVAGGAAGISGGSAGANGIVTHHYSVNPFE